MTNVNELIGKQIAFDIDGCNYASSYLNNEVIPKIKIAILCYEELKVLKPFSIETFNEWVTTNGESVRNAYMEIAKKDAKKFALPAMQEMAIKHGEEATKYFITAWHDAVRALPFQTQLYNIHFNFSAIRINEELEPVVNLDVVDGHFKTRIETEQQARFWEAGQRAESVLGELFELCSEADVDMSRVFWTGETGKTAIFDYTTGGKLKFNTDVISMI